MHTSDVKWKKALRAAFPHTIPVLTGYCFLGMTYGIFAHASGFNFCYPLALSMVVYAGSAEFMAISLLQAPFNPLQAFLITLMINARHLFYGISMLEKYKGTGWKKLYLIFGMSDETFSVVYTTQPPPGVDGGWFMFFITFLDQLYWVFGATLGGLFGTLVHFNTAGLEFVMTAMFVVIFLNQWMKEKRHVSACIGIALSAVCLLIFGADDFLIPSMAFILIVLTALRKQLEQEVRA